VGEHVPEPCRVDHAIGRFRPEDLPLGEHAELPGVFLGGTAGQVLAEEGSDVETRFDRGLELPLDDGSLFPVREVRRLIERS
jgi:hypothetical protein